MVLALWNCRDLGKPTLSSTLSGVITSADQPSAALPAPAPPLPPLFRAAAQGSIRKSGWVGDLGGRQGEAGRRILTVAEGGGDRCRELGLGLLGDGCALRGRHDVDALGPVLLDKLPDVVDHLEVRRHIGRVLGKVGQPDGLSLRPFARTGGGHAGDDI